MSDKRPSTKTPALRPCPKCKGSGPCDLCVGVRFVSLSVATQWMLEQGYLANTPISGTPKPEEE